MLKFTWFDTDAGAPSWSELERAMIAVKVVVQGLVNFVQNHSLNKKALEQQVFSPNVFNLITILTYFYLTAGFSF